MTTDDPDLKYDRSLLGVDHDIGTYDVTKEMIISFARSTGETGVQYLDEEAAKNTVATWACSQDSQSRT